MIFKTQTKQYISTLNCNDLETTYNHVKRFALFYSFEYILNLKREIRLRKLKLLKNGK